MKVNLNTNTSFKGLFTDKSSENGGNWRMEYQPYSWEGKMAAKVKLNITASSLPKNEEIFVSENGKEISKDILGTVSYLKDTQNGNDVLRRTITEKPAMNLEDSLKVFERKLQVFYNMKQEVMQYLKRNLSEKTIPIQNIAAKHDAYALDITRGWASHMYEKDERAAGVKSTFDKMKNIALELSTDYDKYIKLSESSDIVRQKVGIINQELAQIEAAKLSKTFVDKSLEKSKPYEWLPGLSHLFERSKDVLIALPNTIVYVRDIVENSNGDMKKAIEYIEKLIKKGV